MKRIFLSTIAMIRENPLRGFLSLFSLIAGAYLLGSAWGVADGMQRLVTAAEGQQGLVVAVSNGTLSTDGSYDRHFPPQFDSSVKDIVAQSLPNASAVSPVLNTPFGRIMVGDKQYQIRTMLGVAPAYLDVMGLKLVAGSAFTDEDVARKSPVILLSEATAAALFGGSDQAVGKTIQMLSPGRRAAAAPSGGGTTVTVTQLRAPAASGLRGLSVTTQNITVAGVYSVPGDTVRRRLGIGDALLPYTAALPGGINIPEAFFWGTSVFNARDNSLENVRNALTGAFVNRYGDDTQVAVWEGNPTSPQTQATNTAGILRTLALLITGLGLVLVLVAGVGMYGIMTVEVAGRSRQYGIRRALGAKSSDIVRLVIGQSAGMATLGSLIGLIASAVTILPFIKQLSPWFERVGLRSDILDTLGFNPVPMIVALCAIVLASAIFGLLPGIRVAKASPVTLLREDNT